MNRKIRHFLDVYSSDLKYEYLLLPILLLFSPSKIIVDSRLKELHPLMPVMYIKALTQDKQEMRNLYECPIYKTRQRGPTYVWTFNLKTKERASKWVLAGVALLLQI